MVGCTTITEINEATGEPLAPGQIKTTFVNQLGYLVRESVPIKYKLWKRNKVSDRPEDIVPDSEKDLLWKEVSLHFNFPPGKADKVKGWAFKKMAIQFGSFKKKLVANFVNKGLTPDFDKVWKKQREWWNEFVNYKHSADSMAASIQGKMNASKKKNFHRLGPGGYKVAIPKWEKMENNLIVKGIVPQTLSWPKRARYYFYAHGGTLDPDTGMFVTSDVLREAAQRLEDAMRRTEEGTFQPNRENDELTYALGNAEHTGRTRGVGVVPWKYGFSGDLETYRSRCRSKAVVAEKIHSLENRIMSLEAAVGQRSDQPAANVEISPPSQRRSSVASTEHPNLGADRPRDPIDDITVRTQCELLVLYGKKLKVCAEGYAEVQEEGGTIHCQPIPEGFARVFVDRITEERWEDMDLPIPISPEETELQHAVHTWIAWPKRDIRLVQAATDSARCSRQRSPTPADRNPSVGPPSPPPARDPSMDPPSPAAQSEPIPASSPAAQQNQSQRQKAYTVPSVQPSHKQQRKKKAKAPEEEEAEESFQTFLLKRKLLREAANKKPEIDPVAKAHFIKHFIKDPTKEKERESDYDRQIRKCYSNPKNRRINAKTVPQLGEQSKQSIPPLIVPREECPDESRDPLTMAGMILQTDLTRAQLLGEALQNARGKKKFVLGEPLIWPELLPFLPTRMAELHKWYAVQSKANELEMFPARIKDEHFWRGADDVYIEFAALYDLYHQDALHKSLVSVWCM